MTGYEFAKLTVVCLCVFSVAAALVLALDRLFPTPREEVYSVSDHFPQVLNDEVVTPVMDGYLMKCCDCGLVHRFRFRAVKVKKWHGDGTWSYDVLNPKRYRVELSAQRVESVLGNEGGQKNG